MKLTDKQCKSAEAKEKPYKLSDGKGLYLEVTPKSAKYWRMKYRINGKEKRLALGVYPEITLKQARIATDKARELISQDIDPSADKKAKKKKARTNSENTFKSVALEWHKTKNKQWTHQYGHTIMRRLEANIFPALGNRPIADITPPELLDVLRLIEKRGSYDVLKRATQVCGQIFGYGIQTGRCERDASADLKGALQVAQSSHFRTIDLKQLPDFLKALERNEARIYERTRRAVWLSLYTFCRPVEIRTARWSDIDFEARLWTIPASMMKMKRDHIVPLSKQVVKLLKDQQAEVAPLNTDWVFPSQNKLKDSMSDGTVNKAIKRLGFGKDMVAHGFRALARTTIREELDYDSEVIEKQLAHKSAGSLGEAYDRTLFKEKRKAMMQDWADYIDAVSSAGEVINVRFK